MVAYDFLDLDALSELAQEMNIYLELCTGGTVAHCYEVKHKQDTYRLIYSMAVFSKLNVVERSFILFHELAHVQQKLNPEPFKGLEQHAIELKCDFMAHKLVRRFYGEGCNGHKDVFKNVCAALDISDSQWKGHTQAHPAPETRHIALANLIGERDDS